MKQTKTAAKLTAEMLEIQDKLEAARRFSDYFSESLYLDTLAEIRREIRKVA